MEYGLKFFITILLFVNVFAGEVDDILKNVSKNSQNYRLDLTLATKIKDIQYKKIDFNTNEIKIDNYFINYFLKLVKLKQQLKSIPKKIDELQNKLNLLQNSTNPTDKLQSIYYTKLIKNFNLRFKEIHNNFDKWEKQLYEKLNNVTFNLKIAKDNINDLNIKLKQKQKEYEKLNINLQRWELTNNTNNINKTQKYIKINLDIQKNLYKKILKNKLILWFYELKNKNKEVFKNDNELINLAKNINNNFALSLSYVVADFEKLKFGSEVLLYKTKDEIKLTFIKIWDILNYPLFSVSGRIITPINFFLFILVFIIGVYVGKYYKKLIFALKDKYSISHASATLLSNIGYYIIIVVSFLIALKIVGLDLSSLAIIAGALSVGIGFGLQNIVSNSVSGIIMMFERTIKVGDYIEIDSQTRGEVLDISLRSTVIKTNDNINLIIPNQSFIQNNVINWTLGDDEVRFRIPFGVAYGSDIDKVERVIIKALENSDLPYIRPVMNLNYTKIDYTPRVIFEEMADSSLNFELFVWVKGEYARRPRRTKSRFLKLIYNALNEEGISIPFPQQDLHIVDSIPLEFKIKKD